MTDFLDRMADKIDHGLKTVAARGKEIMEVGKLRGEIRDADRLIEGRLLEMGRKVYAMLNQGSLDEGALRTEVEGINTLQRRIASLEEAVGKAELAAQQSRLGSDAVTCPACSGVNRAGDKFCGSCGATLPDRSAGSLCSVCRTPLKEGARFCNRCGKKMDTP